MKLFQSIVFVLIIYLCSSHPTMGTSFSFNINCCWDILNHSLLQNFDVFLNFLQNFDVFLNFLQNFDFLKNILQIFNFSNFLQNFDFSNFLQNFDFLNF